MKTLRSLSPRELLRFGRRIHDKYDPLMVMWNVPRHMRLYKMAKRIVVELDRRMDKL